MELKEIIETLQKAETKIKVQEEAIKHYKEDVKDLEQQITEKDKEIKHLQTQFDMYRALTLQKGFEDPHLMQSIRHQICEEIRESMCCIYDYKNDEYLNGWNDAMHTVYDKLDQIEQGE